MKKGDIYFGVLSKAMGHRIETVQLVEDMDTYCKVKYMETIGSTKVLKSRLFKNKDDAINHRERLIKEDNDKFKEQLSTKENFIKYLYFSAVGEDCNRYNREFFKKKIKEYTGVEV